MRRELRTVLIANRGEIAVRLIRACADAGLTSVAVYANPDRDALFVRLANEAFALGGETPDESYLCVEKLIEVAARCGADTVHPGYGFLSENADFAQAVVDAGLNWVGPSPQVIRDLGDKITARHIAMRAGAPLVPGTADPVSGVEEVIAFASEHGLPVAIKAAFGGGGRGLRVARTLEEIPGLLDSATREAVSAFGRGECFVELYLDKPRHVEAQILADDHGNVVVVGTRDCSLQRRHQKLLEEAPAPFLTEEQRATIHSSARAICAEAGYSGAGTVEYLVGTDGTISFLEVNTRLQVEHPVSEESAGVDLACEQLRITAGEKLRFTKDLTPRGHSIEFRINGEDAGRNFLPAPGTVTRLVAPDGPGVRVDAGVDSGTVISGAFDSLLAKLIVTGEDRTQALQRARRALDEMAVDGMATVLPFHRAIVRDPAFVGDEHSFNVHTQWIESEFNNTIEPYQGAQPFVPEVTVFVGGRPMRVQLPGLGSLGARADEIRAASATLSAAGYATAASGDAVTAPMQGTVVKVAVSDGQQVEAGELIAVLEAMKMENPVTAHKSGTIADLAMADGQTCSQGEVLCKIKDDLLSRD